MADSASNLADQKTPASRARSAVAAAKARAQTKDEERKARREAEAVLVEKARGGDQQAFRTLVESNQGRLFAVAVGILKDRDDAMDAVQDAFIKAHRKLSDFEGNAAFSTWIYRICVNLCIDKKRSQARRRAVDIDDERGPELSEENIYADAAIAPRLSGSNPLKNVANEELAKHIDGALSELSDDHRSVVLLREVEGMSYEEISQTLDIPKGTVMSRLFHARKNLQKRLRPYLGLAEGEALDAGSRKDPETDEETDEG